LVAVVVAVRLSVCVIALIFATIRNCSFGPPSSICFLEMLP